MALIITLPPDLEAMLRQRAEAEGRSIEAVALDILWAAFEPGRLSNTADAESPGASHRRRGSAAGQLQIAPDFDEPLDDFAAYT